MRKTAGALDPRHPVPERCEPGDEWLWVSRGDEPDDHVPDGDHILNLHPQKSPETVSRKVGNDVPVVHEIGEHESGGQQPDTGLDDADIRGKVPVPLADVNRANGLQARLRYPCNEDQQGEGNGCRYKIRSDDVSHS